VTVWRAASGPTRPVSPATQMRASLGISIMSIRFRVQPPASAAASSRVGDSPHPTRGTTPPTHPAEQPHPPNPREQPHPPTPREQPHPPTPRAKARAYDVRGYDVRGYDVRGYDVRGYDGAATRGERQVRPLRR
jgi:hypothetical protein